MAPNHMPYESPPCTRRILGVSSATAASVKVVVARRTPIACHQRAQQGIAAGAVRPASDQHARPSNCSLQISRVDGDDKRRVASQAIFQQKERAAAPIRTGPCNMQRYDGAKTSWATHA